MQTEGRPRPPPGNTVITIITYRALILISPSYVSLSPPRAPPPPPLSLPRRFVRTYLALPLAKRESLYILFPRNLSREPINTDSLLSPCRVTLVNGRLARPRLCLLAFSTGRSVDSGREVDESTNDAPPRSREPRSFHAHAIIGVKSNCEIRLAIVQIEFRAGGGELATR